MHLSVRKIDGTILTLDVASTGVTVMELKTALARQCDIPAEAMRLVYSGRQLAPDASTLDSHHVVDGDTIHLVRAMGSTVAPKQVTNSSNGLPANLVNFQQHLVKEK